MSDFTHIPESIAKQPLDEKSFYTKEEIMKLIKITQEKFDEINKRPLKGRLIEVIENEQRNKV